MSSLVSRLKFLIGADVKGFLNGIQKSQRTIAKFTRNISRMGGAIGLAFGGRELLRFGRDVEALAAKARGIVPAFERLGRPGVLRELQEGVRGTVSNLELMRQTVRASNFQIPIEKLGKLFEFASIRAKETGVAVDGLVDSIIGGIGRKSPLILDNLGISAVRLRKALKGVGIETASVGEITKVVLGIIDEDYGDMPPIIDKTAEASERLAAAWEDFKTLLGDQFLDNSAEFKDNLVDLIKNVSQEDLENIGTGMKVIGRGIEYALTPIKEYLRYSGAFIQAVKDTRSFLKDSWLQKASDLFVQDLKKGGLGKSPVLTPYDILGQVNANSKEIPNKGITQRPLIDRDIADKLFQQRNLPGLDPEFESKGFRKDQEQLIRDLEARMGEAYNPSAEWVTRIKAKINKLKLELHNELVNRGLAEADSPQRVQPKFVQSLVPKLVQEEIDRVKSQASLQQFSQLNPNGFFPEGDGGALDRLSTSFDNFKPIEKIDVPLQEIGSTLSITAQQITAVGSAFQSLFQIIQGGGKDAGSVLAGIGGVLLPLIGLIPGVGQIASAGLAVGGGILSSISRGGNIRHSQASTARARKFSQ